MMAQCCICNDLYKTPYNVDRVNSKGKTIRYGLHSKCVTELDAQLEDGVKVKGTELKYIPVKSMKEILLERSEQVPNENLNKVLDVQQAQLDESDHDYVSNEITDARWERQQKINNLTIENIANAKIQPEKITNAEQARNFSGQMDVISQSMARIQEASELGFISIETEIVPPENVTDAHTQKAMNMYGVKEKEVTLDMRRMAKAFNFGNTYGEKGIAEKLSDMSKEVFSSAGVPKDLLDNLPGGRVIPFEDNTVTISLGYYNSLLKKVSKLNHLEQHGVDNWSGYGGAVHSYNAEYENE